MIRVLHVIGKMDRAGAETMLMNIYRKIDRRKIQFDFLVFTSERADYDDEIEKLGGNIYRLTTFRGYNYLDLRPKINKFFAEHKYQIVHGHMGSLAPLYLSAAKRYGAYTIAHSHATNSNIFFERVLFDFFSHRVRNIADFFMACSKQAGIDRFGVAIVESDRFKIINNGIDTVQYRYSIQRAEKLKKEFHLEDKIIYGHIGRFVPSKNHQFLIKVFYEVVKKNQNSVLLLIGRGSEIENIKNMVSELHLKDHVFFLGVREDIPDLLNLMDVFIFPSLYEGLGIVGIEAQATGLPCFFSEGIVDEAIVTSHAWKYSLDLGPKKWADYIQKKLMEFKREDSSDKIIKAGFDIISTVKELEQIYCNNMS